MSICTFSMKQSTHSDANDSLPIRTFRLVLVPVGFRSLGVRYNQGMRNNPALETERLFSAPASSTTILSLTSLAESPSGLSLRSEVLPGAKQPTLYPKAAMIQGSLKVSQYLHFEPSASNITRAKRSKSADDSSRLSQPPYLDDRCNWYDKHGSAQDALMVLLRETEENASRYPSSCALMKHVMARTFRAKRVKTYR
jgi:hypothetical protein